MLKCQKGQHVVTLATQIIRQIASDEYDVYGEINVIAISPFVDGQSISLIYYKTKIKYLDF